MYEKAVQMIERFYGCEDDETEDADVVPMVPDGAATFAFGMAESSGTVNVSTMTPSKSPSACGLESNDVRPVFGSPIRTLNLT